MVGSAGFSINAVFSLPDKSLSADTDSVGVNLVGSAFLGTSSVFKNDTRGTENTLPFENVSALLAAILSEHAKVIFAFVAGAWQKSVLDSPLVVFDSLVGLEVDWARNLIGSDFSPDGEVVSYVQQLVGFGEDDIGDCQSKDCWVGRAKESNGKLLGVNVVGLLGDGEGELVVGCGEPRNEGSNFVVGLGNVSAEGLIHIVDIGSSGDPLVDGDFEVADSHVRSGTGEIR